MSKFLSVLLAGTATASLLSVAVPASSHPTKPTHPAKTHAAAHAAAHPSKSVTKHEAPHVKMHATTTVRGHEKAHAHAAPAYTHGHTMRQHGVARETVTRVEEESTTRLREIGHTATPIGRVKADRVAIHILTQRRPAITNAKFVTGTVVSRQNNVVVLRTQSGNTVTVAAQSVPVPAVIVPGATVVLPVQYLNSQLVLIPAFGTAQEAAMTSGPVLAPCAVNDNDADDTGDTSYYAPANACLNNDGDADDGNTFTFSALPSSFGTMPQIFTSAYAPAVAAGFVVAQVGQNVILMTPNFKPLVVNASAALASGATNGSLSPGRFVTVYGFDVNNTLVATSLM